MKLIYRRRVSGGNFLPKSCDANIFDFSPRPIQPYVKPRALNWRFHPPGQKFECTPVPIQPYIKPRVINWRFQLAANPSQTIFYHFMAEET